VITRRSITSLVTIAAVYIAASLAAQTTPTMAPNPAPQKPGLTLTTTAFEDGGVIPNQYTRAAAPARPISPPLSWSHVPDGTVSFALVVQDPDTALNHRTDEVVHWMIFNIPGTATSLPEGVPAQAQLPDGSVQTVNARKIAGYIGPGMGPAGPYHHYTFQLYALDSKLTLGSDATLTDVEAAMQNHILGKGVLVGRFHLP
jgi:Raf kinase inhibitor-like YbhB/YbcL family protein